ncbi:MAG: SDR family oxidoreductase [Bacteroidota bacterium]
MDLNLRDRIILVSGGSRGIGEAIVRVLSSEGATPVIISNDADGNATVLESIRQQSPGSTAWVAELTDPEACKQAVEQVLEHYGRLDGLVNNAGINDKIGLEHGDSERFNASLHRNLVHYYLLAHHALPALKASSGAIVNIVSKTAETGQGGTSAYAAANGGRSALTREWAVELLPYGIRVNAVVVAECYTPLYESWVNSFPDPAEKLKQITARIPLGKRMTTGAEIADAVAFLLSDRSGHTTGQLLHVDGGYVHLDRAIS